MNFYIIDCDKESIIIQNLINNTNLKVKSYPSIWYFKDGYPFKEYTKERNITKFISETIKYDD